MQDNILEMRDITKSFFGVKVLKNAQLTVKRVRYIFYWEKMEQENLH